MQCPKCHGAMETVRLGGLEVDRCTNCFGLWFDLQEDERLKGIPGSESIDTGAPELGRQYNEVRKYDCPRCHTQMIKMVDAGKTELQYESCKFCYGLFFDAGEFRELKGEQIQPFFQHWYPRTFRP